MQAQLTRLMKLLLSCQVFAMSGCNYGWVASQSSPSDLPAKLAAGSDSHQQSWKNNLLAGNAPQESDLWVNVTAEDLADEASQLNIVANNNSQYNLEFLGCDQQPFLKSQLVSIPAGYQFPLRRDFDPHWSFLDPAAGGLFDSAQITRNSLRFSNTPSYCTVNCYYRAFVSEANAWLHFKLVNTIYSVSSYSPNGQPKLTQPQVDKLHALQSSSWLSHTSPLWMDIMAGAFSYLYLVKYYPSFNPTEYLSSQLQDSLYEWTNRLNRLLINYRRAAISRDGEFDFVQARELIRQLVGMDGHGNRYFKITNFQRFLAKAAGPNSEYIFGITYDGEANRFLLEYRNFDGAFLDLRPVNKDSEYVSGEPLPSPADEIQRLGLNNDPDAFRKLFGRGQYAGTDSKFAVEIADLEQIGLNSNEIISFGAANTTIDTLSLGFSAGVTLAFIVIQYYLIQPLINGIFDQPAVGTFSTGINHLRLAEVSPADAISWNQTHNKAQHIAANSQLSVVAKNSLFQNVKLSFLDPDIDSQFNLTITLGALTTPWSRYAAYDPFGNNRDPYLGCVDKNGRCSDGTPTHKADAVISMTIRDNQPKPGKDLDNLYSLAVYHAAGLEQLARDRLLPAPLYSGVAVVNNLANNQMRNGRLIQRTAKLNLFLNAGVKHEQSAADKIVLLNSGQALDLNVAIPPVGGQLASASPLSQDSGPLPLYGGGFAVRYIETPLESRIAPFVLFNSTKLAQALSRESAANILLAKFSCSFPLPRGDSCQLRLAIPGSSDGRHHQGRLLIADANSRTLSLPVYLNYRLISQPSEFSVSVGDLNPYRLQVMNAATERYAQIQLSGLPSGSQIRRNSCFLGLDSGANCQLEFNFARVTTPGNYLLTLIGVTAAGKVGEADQSQLRLDIRPRF